MHPTQDGRYAPQAESCVHCGLCMSACPSTAPKPPALEEPLGVFHETLIGFSTTGEERLRSSSGGLATRVLKALLSTGQVDAVVAATATGDRHPPAHPLFRASVLRSTEDVDCATGSKYYPLEFSSPLQELRSSGETFALVGLPCVITALRRGQEHFQWLRNQCKHLIGLTCGHLVTTHYTTFLSAVSGVAPEDVVSVDYRRKPGPTGAGDFKFVATGDDGTTGEELPFSSGGGIPVILWGTKLFTPPACFRCSDLFAVDADLTLMDAWLPEYREERDGTSLAVVRSEAIRELLEDEQRAGRVHLEAIEPDRVIQSQAGALASRRVNAALLQSESGGPRMPFRMAVQSRYERMRSELSNRLMAGGPGQRNLGMTVIRAWLRGHRALRRLRSLAARVFRGIAALWRTA